MLPRPLTHSTPSEVEGVRIAVPRSEILLRNEHKECKRDRNEDYLAVILKPTSTDSNNQTADRFFFSLSEIYPDQ